MLGKKEMQKMLDIAFLASPVGVIVSASLRL